MFLRKLRAALRLPAADKALFCQAWLELLVVEALLHAWTFPRVTQRAARVRRNSQPLTLTDSDWASVRRCQRLVGMASRHHLFPMTCLRQALTLQLLLGRQGLATELRIGTRKDNGEFKAHAWLEVSGQPVEKRKGEVERFTILAPMDLK